MKNSQLNLFGETMEVPKSTSPKSKIEVLGQYKRIEMFLYYPKLKDNPNGDPVAKQADRQNIMTRSNAPMLYDSAGGKYYRKEDMYIHHYQPSFITKTTESLSTQANLLMRGNEMFKIEVVIEEIIYQFSPLKSFTKANIIQMNNGVELIKTTKPDMMDNLNKLLMDSLSKVVFYNDALIWKSMNVRKVYSVIPGVLIKLIGR